MAGTSRGMSLDQSWQSEKVMVKHGAKVLEHCRKLESKSSYPCAFHWYLISPNVQEIIARGGLEKWVKKEIEAGAWKNSFLRLAHRFYEIAQNQPSAEPWRDSAPLRRVIAKWDKPTDLADSMTDTENLKDRPVWVWIRYHLAFRERENEPTARYLKRALKSKI